MPVLFSSSRGCWPLHFSSWKSLLTFFNYMYRGDSGWYNYTGVMWTTLWCIICMLHCEPTTQRQTLPSPYTRPPVPFSTSPALFLLVAPHCCLCGFSFVCLVCSLVVLSYISHVWVKSYGCWIFLSDLIHLARYSQDFSMLSQSSFLVVTFSVMHKDIRQSFSGCFDWFLTSDDVDQHCNLTGH